jgi:hypothetical protein
MGERQRVWILKIPSAIITFLTGVIQGGATFYCLHKCPAEHLTSTGKALGIISLGIEETEQFNHVAFMDDITVVAQDNTGSQILMEAVQKFETWSNTKLNLNKTVVMGIDGGSGKMNPPQVTYKQQPVTDF